jgi:LuxR family transcriptional activator of conjugal transfer of Ti plasmids
MARLQELTTGIGGSLPLASSMNPPIGRADASTVEFGRFVDETEDVTQPERLFELVCAFAQNLDCPWVAYGSLTHHDKLLRARPTFPTVLLNYPQEWRERYFGSGYERVDPIVTKSRQRATAFRWSEIYNKSDTAENERRIFDEAASFGLKTGVSIPLHGPDGRFAVMSFAQPREYEFKSKIILYLQVAACHFHAMISKLAHNLEIRHFANLSIREKECLLWAAKGKSSWDTGMILGISENTVNFHIKNAMRKLDSRSRTVAAIKALRLGLIEL